MKKNYIFLLCFTIIIFINHPSLRAQCSVTISGDTCSGNILTAHFSGGVAAKFEWDYNGNPVRTVVADTFSANGITVAGGNGYGAAANQLENPQGVYVNKNGTVYVVDNINHRVQKWLPGATNGITVAGGNGLVY